MMTCIFGRGRTLPSCRLAAIGILVGVLLFCHGRAWALNQINNGAFLSNWSGWTIDNQVIRGFPLEAFYWVATEGAPVGSIYGGMITNNRQGDGLVEQKFTTPAGFVRASAYLQHKASSNKKSGKNNRTTVTLRLDGSAAYPNETIITTFLSLVQDSTTAFQTLNWTTPVTLRPGTSYLFRLYWDIKTNGALGFYFDNIKLNISPSGLRTDDNGTDVFLSWNPSVGTVALKEYRVFRATTSGGPYTQIATTTATTYTDAGMVSDNIYYYVVQDVDVNNDVSPNSIEAVFFKIKVRDGPSQDIAYSWLTDRVEANWDHPKASLLRYKVAVGTTPGGNDVKDWTDVGMANTVTFTGLNLASGTTYYTTVQSQDALEIDQGKGSSNGFMIRTDPVFVDTASSTFFNNSRLQTMIDFTTDTGSIRPKTFASGGFWSRRVPVTVREPGVTDRINAPCRITFNIPVGAPAALAEIRVADDQGNEVPRVVGGTLANPVVTFLVNMPKSDSRIYYVYWGNTGAPEPAYGFTNGVTQTAALQYSPYYSRKLLAAGIESVPLAFNYGYRESPAVISGDPDPGNTAPESWAEEFEYFNAAGGYAVSAGWRNDCRGQQITNLFGGTFWFFGTNTPNWWIWSNGLLFNATANASNWSTFTGAVAESFVTFTGNTRWQGGLIAPLWVDLTYNDDTVIDTPGVYRDTYADREVFTWRSSMNADPTDDTYVFQTVLYKTGDIAHRYDYLSPSSVTTANASGHPILNDINAVGISANNGTNYLTNTPLELGLGQTPSSFFQCDHAFDGYYTVGTIENPVGGWSNVADFDSKVFDSRLETPNWVQLEYDCTGDATGRLLFYVRTGNTALPELGGWNSWVNIATATANGFAAIPSADLRYCQYKVVFQRSSNGAMPVLNEVRLICGGLSIESITTNTPDGVCQGQTGIPVGVTLKNTYINPVSLTNATLSFSLGSYTFTLVSPTLPATINPGVATAATFTVSVADASPVGLAVIQAQATGTSGPSTFFDRDAQIPGSWLVRKKATLVIKEVRTVPTAVNKGQNGIPVFIDLENTGETPLVFNGASLTFSLGFYTQTLISPALGTVIPGPGSLTVQISVNVLSNSPSGISTIDATASGTNAFSGKPADAAGAVVKDAWTIQSPSDLVLVSITASSTVYRGQTGIPVFLTVQNIREAPASWTSSTLLPYFTLGSYDAVYPVTPFPTTVLGGQSLTVQYGVDISPLSATGTSSIDARIDWLDGNMGDAKFYERALLPATWTIMAEVVKSYKDAAGLYPSTSFNRPVVDSTIIYAKGENLAPFKDFVVRWYDPSGTEVASSNPPLTALASGTLSHQYAIGPASPFGLWTIRITNPLNTIVSCQTSFEVVNGASLTASLSLPLTVSVGQPFQAVMSCSNIGGARIRDAYPGVLASSGTGIATLTAGPTPDSQDILGYTSATFTWMWRATSAGTFIASDVAFGVDANADLALRSATATSNVCVIQTPPSLSLLSLTATPTLVYRNQKNIEVEARVLNSGQATAMLTTASLSFTLGTYTQAIATPSVLPATIPGNNAVATITFMVDVDIDSPEGLATLTFGMRAYDANVPASVTILAPSSPNDRWTIGSIGIQLSRETDFSTEQYAFNRGQDVKIRAFGLPPYSPGYRFRLYSSTIPNSSPAPVGWIDVSNRLTATSKGWVDYVYTLPAGAALTRWSVEIETDPDSNSTTRDQLLAVNYFDVQTAGNLVASLTLSPNPVFVDDTVTVTLVASNTTPSGSSVSPATPSALINTAASTGAMSYQTGPTPASSSVSALASTSFIWTYKATDDTGTVGSYSLTAQLPCSVYGVDANTGAPINSQAAISNGLKIYRRAMALSQSAFDLGSFAPGETTTTIPFQVGNIGNLILSAVKWNKVDLNGVFPLSISHAYVTLAPSPVGTINPDASAAVSIGMTIPYNQASGTYATTMSVYEDMNGNGNPDSIEPYKIFTVTVNVLSRPKVFVVEDLIDLGNWSPGQTTNAKAVNLFNGGNQAVTNVRFTQTVGSATFLAVSPNPGNLAIGEARVASASAAIPAATPQGVYVATWTMWADTDGDGSIDAGEASDTFQVRVGVGSKQLTLSPAVLSAGIGTPSTIISGLQETITNTGSLSLTNLKASLQALQDGMGNSIATDNISIIPPASVVTTGTATVALFVPPGMIMGAYSGVQTLYEDSNGNGVLDPDEASGTFTLTVSIPAYPAVQVLVPTVELGDLAPGAVVTVPFACRNSGNVTLSRLMWTKLPLVSGVNTIPAADYDFPPGVPFSAAPGAIFTRDLKLTVNVAQAAGDYTGSSAWLFDDTDLGLDRDAGEPQSPFIIKCRIGSAALDIENPSYATSGPPATFSAEAAIKFRNTGSLTITSLVATCSALVGPQTIPASASFVFPVSGSLVPAPLGSILIAGQKFGYWRVLVPANTLPGVYTGTLTAWNDINGDKLLQSYEASDTCALNLTVTSSKAINVLQSNLDLGWTTENSVVSGMIEIVNTGNQNLTMVRAVIATLSSGIDVIPASSIVYLPAVPGGFAVGQSQLATITVTVGSPKADGTYVATHRIYDDYNTADGSYNSGNEENDTFTITLRIGHKSVFETDPTNPPVDFGPQDPGGTVVKNFTTYNGSAIPLANLRWKNLVPLTGTGYTFPLASLTWSPAVPFGIPGNGNISCSATAELASFVPPDVYTGVSTVWEDENGDGIIQAAEATANFQVKLTVNPRPLITLLPGMVDFGRIGRGQASGWVGICYYNGGNVPLNAFSWAFANIGDGAGHAIPAAAITFDPLFNPDPTPAGSYGTTTVRIGPVDPLQELGTYDQSGPQVISAGGGVVSDDCQFRCEIIQGGPIGLSSGTVYQEVATSTFQPPECRYVLSAYVCPGTGSARISFFDTTEGGTIVFQPWVEIGSDGSVQGNTTGSGEFGVVETWPARFGPSVYTWYRIYVSFDYALDPVTASKTYILLGNTSPVSPPTASYSVWFDGVQLEKPDNQTQKRPTAFAPGKKIVSPHTELDLSGKKYYFEW